MKSIRLKGHLNDPIRPSSRMCGKIQASRHIQNAIQMCPNWWYESIDNRTFIGLSFAVKPLSEFEHPCTSIL